MTLTAQDILTKLQEKQPLSIIRYGDGECIVLNGFNEYSRYNDVLKRQLCFSPPIDHAIAIRQNLIEAYKGADIIGIPMHKNLDSLNSHWKNAKITLDANVFVHTDQYCSINVGYDFLEHGLFDQLLQNIQKLNYISCRDLDEAFQRRYNIEVVNKKIIAPEAKFTSGYDGDVHYPTQFNHIPRWMDVVCKQGDLLLVGAGVIGKIYCNWWRDRGGIAFDIGSIFDEWCGKATRGEGRGLDAENNDLKYKL